MFCDLQFQSGAERLRIRHRTPWDTLCSQCSRWSRRGSSFGRSACADETTVEQSLLSPQLGRLENQRSKLIAYCQMMQSAGLGTPAQRLACGLRKESEGTRLNRNDPCPEVRLPCGKIRCADSASGATGATSGC